MSRLHRPVALLVALVLGCAPLGACGRGGGTYRMTAYFDRAVSLYAGSDVRVLGLPAGKITSVRADGTKVRVDMAIRTDVPVPADAKAMIVPLSLIGERYVQLFPAWTDGTPKAKPGMVIPLDRTGIPVEPDEALAALKRFLDALDPNATGRLVKNLADDMKGNGKALNDAISGLSQLSQTFAEKDQQLASIVDHFDRFTATMATREQQLGKVLDGFATTAQVLAQERQDIEKLISSLASLSTNALDLVSEHRAKLQKDLDVLTQTLQAVIANLDSVRELLDAAPLQVAGANLDGKGSGLINAYDPYYHRIDLRDALSPVVSDLLATIGVNGIVACVPVGTVCPPGGVALPALPASASTGPTTAAGSTTEAGAGIPAGPVTTVAALLGSPTDARTTRAAELVLASARTPTSRPNAVVGAWRSAGRLLEQVLP
ncbi:MAG TPA: MCE family protein [Acidimicrobiales bacterium]|nr:MCE family protein [Acidimicrobiales bacterium]